MPGIYLVCHDAHSFTRLRGSSHDTSTFCLCLPVASSSFPSTPRVSVSLGPCVLCSGAYTTVALTSPCNPLSYTDMEIRKAWKRVCHASHPGRPALGSLPPAFCTLTLPHLRTWVPFSASWLPPPQRKLHHRHLDENVNYNNQKILKPQSPIS